MELENGEELRESILCISWESDWSGGWWWLAAWFSQGERMVTGPYSLKQTMLQVPADRICALDFICLLPLILLSHLPRGFTFLVKKGENICNLEGSIAHTV